MTVTLLKRPHGEGAAGAPPPATLSIQAELARLGRELMRDLCAPAPRTKDADYECELLALQRELVKVQNWVRVTGQKILILFEGRDAAGKGGTIKRIVEHLDNRTARVVALDKPTEREAGQWYLQRYVQHLPARGEICLFDRSWYNRAVIEPVMGYCQPADYDEFMRHCPEFERSLAASGMRLFKFCLTISEAEQRRRLDRREADPLKSWKVSSTDRTVLARWSEYSAVEELALASTHRPEAPWIVVRTDDKKTARLAVLQHLLDALPYPGKDTGLVIGAHPDIAGPPRRRLDMSTGKAHSPTCRPPLRSLA
jgi:polyphosphate kinase 2